MPWVVSAHACQLPTKTACDTAGVSLGSVWKCDTCQQHWQIQSLNTGTGGPVYVAVQPSGNGSYLGGLQGTGVTVTREGVGNQTTEQAKVLNLGLKL